MKISWFIPENNYFIRVEEDLINLSEYKLVFAREGKQYLLKSSYNLKDLLFDDVLYAFQLNDRLYPIRGSPVYNPEILLRKYIDIEPDELKELIENATIDLKQEIDKLKKLIQFEMKKNAEDDIKKMEFIQNIDNYRNILYKKFLDLFKENIDDLNQDFKKFYEEEIKKVENKSELVANKKKIEPQIKKKVQIKQPKQPQMINKEQTQSQTLKNEEISSKNNVPKLAEQKQQTSIEKVPLKLTNKKKSIQNLFR
ncbi:MAG: hypothetical protein ACTSRZ_07995 [Promethearchaeota archaeon]